jgi:hypothetical protein
MLMAIAVVVGGYYYTQSQVGSSAPNVYRIVVTPDRSSP